MSIALFTVEPFAIDEVAAILRREGLEVITRKLTPGLKPVGEVNCAVLIYPGQGVVAIGEQTAIVRDILGDRSPLMLCMPRPSPADRDLLQRCGASSIITPNSWSFTLISERILAELILANHGHPSGFGILQGATRPMRELYRDMETLAPSRPPSGKARSYRPQRSSLGAV